MKRIHRTPVALQPRIGDLDAVVRRQKAEIEGLRAALALANSGSGGSWGNQADISLKIARLLRVLRLRYVRPNSLAWIFAQWVSRVVDAWLELERVKTCDMGEEAEDRLAALVSLLGLSDPYLVWKDKIEPELDRAAGLTDVTRGPLISIIMPVYKLETSMLKAALTSLRAQRYQDWEACISFADPDRTRGQGAANLMLLKRLARKDSRFRVRVLEDNIGISGNSNAALDFAKGDYIALLDHDDVLPPLALSRMAAAIRVQPRADFLYSDKENLSEAGERHYQPLFKPDWSPEMLYSVNYLTHLNLIRADLMAAIGGWARGVDGAQDWDLFLRATEKAGCIVRVAGVGYSWRVHQGSTASGLQAKPYALSAQLRALERHAERTGLAGRFEPHPETGFRLRWREVAPARVVVFGHGDLEALETLVGHLGRERASFTSVDVLLKPEARWRFASTWRRRAALPSWCRLVPVLGGDPMAACLESLEEAVESVTLFLDGGLLVCTPGALGQLAGWLRDDGPIAFASGVTVEQGDQVVEAGCVVDQAGVAHPLFRGEPLHTWNLFGGALWHRNVEAASPHLLALRTADARRVLSEVPAGGWRERFHDACQRLVAERGERGRGVVDPNARAILAANSIPAGLSQGLIGPARRYLHPYLTVAPGGGLVLAKEPSHAAPVQAA